MATPVFVVGYDKGVSLWLTGGSVVFTTINITAWSWEESVNALVVTHTGSGGIAARIAGILDGEGTIEGNYDSANLIHASPPNIRAGARGQIKIQTGATNPFLIPVIVQKVPYKSAVDGLVQYTFTVQMDSQSGTYTYPS